MELADQVEGRRNKIKTQYGTASPFDFAKTKTSKRISALNESPMNETVSNQFAANSSRNRGKTETKHPANRNVQQLDEVALDTKINAQEFRKDRRDKLANSTVRSPFKEQNNCFDMSMMTATGGNDTENYSNEA